MDDEVLRALCDEYTGEDGNRANEVLRLKQDKLVERGGSTKAIVNDVRKWVIGSLKVQDAGDNAFSFLRDTIVPLIRPTTRVYAALEKDVFD